MANPTDASTYCSANHAYNYVCPKRAYNYVCLIANVSDGALAIPF